ncbi:MAG: hypothetical protein ABJP25_05440 [Sneathiella sp.]
MLAVFGWKIPILLYQSISLPTVFQNTQSYILLLLTMLALVLVCLPQKMARWAMVGIDHPEKKVALSFDELQHALFSAVGLIFIVLASVQLFSLSEIAIRWEDGIEGGAINYFIAPLCKLLVGLFLLFGAQSLRGLLARLRS